MHLLTAPWRLPACRFDWRFSPILAHQSVIGGVAHLLNFDGSDTMSACYYAQYVLNGGRPVAQSVPASEHRRASELLPCATLVLTLALCGPCISSALPV